MTGSGPAESIKVDIGRASAVAVVMAVLVFAALGAGGLYAALDSAETGVRVIGYVIAGLSGLLLLAFVTAIEQPPDLPSLPLSVQGAIRDYVGDKIKSAVKLDGKRSIAVEIFPVDPAAAARHAILTRYRREQPAPAAGLPPVRWRLPLPPVVGVARGVERGVRTFQEQRWLGWFARPWTGGLVR
jgi:hypothetical protein